MNNIITKNEANMTQSKKLISPLIENITFDLRKNRDLFYTSHYFTQMPIKKQNLLLKPGLKILDMTSKLQLMRSKAGKNSLFYN